MTSAQTMRTRALRAIAARTSCLTTIALTCVALASCEAEPKLAPPTSLVSPYRERQVWAVAPFVNESGVSIVAGDRVADAFTTEVEGIDGIDTLPVNRVIAAMRRLGLNSITTPAQARMLLNALGADGLIVGTVTAYDPYQPPKFGAAVALFTSDAAYARSIDPVQLTRARTDTTTSPTTSNTPTAQASGIFDASNHETLIWLDQYAAGRNEPASAYEERIYLVRMDLYTQFAAHRLLHDLLDIERARLLPVQAEVREGAQEGAQGQEEPDSSR